MMIKSSSSSDNDSDRLRPCCLFQQQHKDPHPGTGSIVIYRNNFNVISVSAQSRILPTQQQQHEPRATQFKANPPPLNKHLGHDTQQRRLSLKFNSVFVIETHFLGWVDPEGSDDDSGGKDGSVPKGGIRCPDERRSRKN